MRADLAVKIKTARGSEGGASIRRGVLTFLGLYMCASWLVCSSVSASFSTQWSYLSSFVVLLDVYLVSRSVAMCSR